MEEAIAAYRSALSEQSRDRTPLDWAFTETNLGAALVILGEREKGTARLEEAVATLHEALKERTREDTPFLWAQTQEKLALAYFAFSIKAASQFIATTRSTPSAGLSKNMARLKPFSTLREPCAFAKKSSQP